MQNYMQLSKWEGIKVWPEVLVSCSQEVSVMSIFGGEREQFATCRDMHSYPRVQLTQEAGSGPNVQTNLPLSQVSNLCESCGSFDSCSELTNPGWGLYLVSCSTSHVCQTTHYAKLVTGGGVMSSSQFENLEVRYIGGVLDCKKNSVLLTFNLRPLIAIHRQILAMPCLSFLRLKLLLSRQSGLI